jgi:hypothetical protein
MVALAIETAKKNIPTDYIEVATVDIFGKSGGFALLNEIGLLLKSPRLTKAFPKDKYCC